MKRASSKIFSNSLDTKITSWLNAFTISSEMASSKKEYIFLSIWKNLTHYSMELRI
jgi:hypothetical protein